MFVGENFCGNRHGRAMIGHADLLSWLRAERDAERIANTDLQALLKLPSSRVAEIFDGRRSIKLDEAKTIVEHYKLEQNAKPIVVPMRVPSEALMIVLQELLHTVDTPDIPERELRVLAQGLERGLSLLAKNPAIHASQDAVRAVAQAIADRPR